MTLTRSISILIATTVVLSFAVVGCNQDDSESVLTPDASTATLGMAPPTLEELQAALNLTPEQKDNVQSALSRWQETNQERASFRRGPGCAEGGPHREGNPGQFGRRGRLYMTFLEDCADGLTGEQFDKLIDLLAEKREQHQATCEATREARQAGHGKHFGQRGSHRGGQRGGQRDGQCATDLGLTEEQHQVMREARREARQAMREGGKNYHEGSLTAAAMRDLAGETLNTLKGSLSNVLDDDQLSKVAERSRERAGRMAERRLEHHDDAAGRRVTFLTKVLALEPSQVSAVEASLSELRSREEALLGGIRDGATNFPDAVYEQLLIKEAGHEALAAILDETQQARLEKLKGFRRGHRGLHLYF